ncbi:MAG: type 4a pilus biogenesis protein PilO [Candidatus Omnitrophota bacterium]
MWDFTANINFKQLEGFLRRKDTLVNIVAVILILIVTRWTNVNFRSRISFLQREIVKAKKINLQSEELKKLQKELAEFQKGLPKDFTAYTALEKINKAAADADIRIISFTPAEAKDKPVVIEYPMSIKLETDYFSLVDFVKKIEELKIFRIMSIEVISKGGVDAAQEMKGKQRLAVGISLLAMTIKNEGKRK